MILSQSKGRTMNGSAAIEKDWSPPELLLEAAGGDDEMIATLIDAFGADTSDRIEQMFADLAVCNLSNIRNQAHTIKGSAGQMGADALADACRELEKASDLQQPVPVAARLSRVKELFDEIREKMAFHVSQSPAPSASR